MSFDFGDLILVPFPFTDQTTTKKRPAVVVSSSEYQRRRPDIVLMALTSQARPSPLYGDLPISEWQAAGLLKASVVKPVLATIHKRLVLKRLGKLQPADIETLRALLAEILR